MLYQACHISSQVYSDLFGENYEAWFSAILYANEMLGPFPNVRNLVQQRLFAFCGSTAPLPIIPMAHEFQMVLPHINEEPHIRDPQFDCFKRYTFTEPVIKTKWETNNMTYLEIADMARQGWSYVGSRVKDGEHKYVFRRKNA